MENFLSLFSIHSDNIWFSSVINAIVLCGFYFIFLFFHKSIIEALLKKFAKNLPTDSSNSIIRIIDKYLVRFILFYVLELIIDGFQLPPRVHVYLLDGIFIVLAFYGISFVFALIDHLSGRLKTWGAHEFQPLFSKILKTLASLICLMIVMRHFNYDIWHIVTALGIGSLAIGLAAQPTLTNMIAGFTLLMDRPFLLGDHILLSSGNEGDVKQIGIRSTWIQMSDGNTLIVPNSELVSSRLINFNFPDSQLLQKLKILFAYNDEFEKIKVLLLQACQSVEGIVPQSARVEFSNILDARLEVTIVYKILNFGAADGTRDRVIGACLRAIKTSPIKLADNSLTLRERV